MYTVYIIRSTRTGKYYIGYTANMKDRLKHHNSGASKSTKNDGPWIVVYTEVFQEKKFAWLRERQIKSYKSGEAFKKLVGGVA